MILGTSLLLLGSIVQSFYKLLHQSASLDVGEPTILQGPDNLHLRRLQSVSFAEVIKACEDDERNE